MWSRFPRDIGCDKINLIKQPLAALVLSFNFQEIFPQFTSFRRVHPSPVLPKNDRDTKSKPVDDEKQIVDCVHC